MPAGNAKRYPVGARASAHRPGERQHPEAPAVAAVRPPPDDTLDVLGLGIMLGLNNLLCVLIGVGLAQLFG
jgi:hypothetical protein